MMETISHIVFAVDASENLTRYHTMQRLYRGKQRKNLDLI